MQPKPSEVRAIIISEHAELRKLLAQLEARIDRLQRGRSEDRRELRGELERFCDAFKLHIGREEKILAPVLRDLDNWGPARIERMDLEHAEQRDRIARICAAPPDDDPLNYVENIRRFCEDLRAEMASEELECLSPDVLRDDTVSIDAFGG